MLVLKSALAAFMLSAVLLGVAGCADQSDQANKLIDQMNTLIGKSNSAEARVTQLVDDVGKINPTTRDVAKAAPMLAEAQATLDQDKGDVRAVVSITKQISALKVDSEMKTYVGQQAEIAQLEEQMQDITADLLATYGELYDPKKASKYSQVELDTLSNTANGLIAKLNALQSTIAERQGASDQYFKDNLQ